MKDLLKSAAVIGAALVLGLGARVAAYAYLQADAAAMTGLTQRAPADEGCGPMAVKMPCFRAATPTDRAMASVPPQSGTARAAEPRTMEAQDPRCAPRQVKMPCLQRANSRS